MSDNKNGILIVISGPAGSGKGTVVEALIKAHPELYTVSVSMTTRVPREREIDGTHYYFTTAEAFNAAIERGEMLEYAPYSGNFYGTPAFKINEKLSSGQNVILEIDVQGALQVKAKRPDALMIFITPPDYKTLENRLRGRGTNTEEDIKRRLNRAYEELENYGKYDYHIVNYDNSQNEAAEIIHGIVSAEGLKTSRNADFPQKFFK